MTPLFRAKRAEHLADLLEARQWLGQAGFRATGEGLRKALESASGRKAVRRVLRYVKASHVGVDMMDITVCGAVAPYGPVVGGKLVGLLLASPQAVAAYAGRYRRAASVIASSIAGRPVRRRPNLVLLGTTSLYGVASSQYNRLRMSVSTEREGRNEAIDYVPVGKTVGFGSFHFSRETMVLLEMVLARHQRGRRVNSIFGEGVNPKLRKVRSALDLLGLPSNLLLQHSSPRLIYAVPLAANFREVLLGLSRRPRPHIAASPGVVSRIAEFWRSRWLDRRIESDAVLEAVKAHTLAHPIRHGARIVLPSVPGEEILFSAIPGQLQPSEYDEKAVDQFADDRTRISAPSVQRARRRVRGLAAPRVSR
jgi:hypothetical protein